MNIGIKGKIIAKTISTFYTVIKPIRNFNYNIFIYLLINTLIIIKTSYFK